MASSLVITQKTGLTGNLKIKFILFQTITLWVDRYTAITRKVVGKNVHATIPKGNMGYYQFTVPDTVAVERTFFTFLTHSQIYAHSLSCHSLKFLWRTVKSKPHTIPFGIVACTFSDNLHRNSCILKRVASLTHVQSWDHGKICDAHRWMNEWRMKSRGWEENKRAHVNSKLGGQHTKAPLAATLNPFMSLQHPLNPWCKWCDVWRLTTTPGSTSPTLFEQWCGFFYVPQCKNQISVSAVRRDLRFFLLIRED